MASANFTGDKSLLLGSSTALNTRMLFDFVIRSCISLTKKILRLDSHHYCTLECLKNLHVLVVCRSEI